MLDSILKGLTSNLLSSRQSAIFTALINEKSDE